MITNKIIRGTENYFVREGDQEPIRQEMSSRRRELVSENKNKRALTLLRAGIQYKLLCSKGQDD